MLRRAQIAGLLLAAVALPALAADFIVNGNVQVNGVEGLPGNLTVTGTSNLNNTMIGQAGTSSSSLSIEGIVLMPTDPPSGTPSCNGTQNGQFGQIGTAPWPNPSNSNETDLMLYFCGWKKVGSTVQAQRYFLNASLQWVNGTPIVVPSWYPGAGQRLVAEPSSLALAGADNAALATRVATLEKQLAALKAITCREHAAEAACQ
jgi:hypothetical protein